MDPTTLPLFATPGTLELAVILLIAVLLFGANKIPKLARSTGQAMGEFQRGRQEIEEELDEMKESATDTPPTTGTEPGGAGESTAEESSAAEPETESADADQSNETEE